MDEPTLAFPLHPQVGNCEDWRFGMSLRDWFAGQVLAGSIRANHRLEFNPDEDAEWSYRVADAMIAERVKERR